MKMCVTNEQLKEKIEADGECVVEAGAPRGSTLREAVEGIADDYMTSENHHPGYVLIPTAKFEQIRAALAVCSTCDGTGKEGRHLICRDCDDIQSTPNAAAFNVHVKGWGEELLYTEDGAKSLITRLRRTKGVDGEATITPLYAAPAPAPASDVELPAELLTRTFAIQHNPNCPSPWLVRMPGKSGVIDFKPYRDQLGIVQHQTGDILGFGKTLAEASSAANAASEGSTE